MVFVWLCTLLSLSNVVLSKQNTLCELQYSIPPLPLQVVSSSLYDSYLLIGAQDPTENSPGRWYLYERKSNANGNTWELVQNAMLIVLRSSVAIWNDIMLIGDPTTSEGQVEVYKYDTIMQKFTLQYVQKGDGSDSLGQSVALRDSVGVMGSPSANRVITQERGWNVTQMISQVGNPARFVATYNETIFFGSGNYDARIYERNSTTTVWSDMSIIPQVQSGQDAHTIAVASPNSYGAVYIFSKNDSGYWNLNGNITAATDSGDRFGDASAISGKYLIVGAPNTDVSSDFSSAGCVYIIKLGRLADGTFIAENTLPLFSPFVTAGEEFGASVAAFQDTLVVSNGATQGSIHIYTCDAFYSEPSPLPREEPQPSPTSSTGSFPLYPVIGAAGTVLLAVTATAAGLLFRRQRNRKDLAAVDTVEEAPATNSTRSSELTTRSTEYEKACYGNVPPSESNSSGTNYSPVASVIGASTHSGSCIETKECWDIQYADLKVGRKLGAGAFGEVWEGKWKGIRVAVKKLLNSEKGQEDFFAELELMKKLKPHPHVVAFLGVCSDPLCLVTEFVANGDLHSLLQKGPLSDDMKLKIIKGTAAGMFYLHQQGVIHRDLAARNILLDELNNPKVSDFGMSRVSVQETGNKTQATVGPIRWMAPEAMSQRIYNTKTDVWSFGVVIYEVLTRKLPYHNLDMLTVALLVTVNKTSLLVDMTAEQEQYPQNLMELMTRCLQHKAEERPEFSNIVDMLD